MKTENVKAAEVIQSCGGKNKAGLGQLANEGPRDRSCCMMAGGALLRMVSLK